MSENIIELKNIVIDYKMKMFNLRAVDGVTLPIKRNAFTALVGESGSGKTTLANSILQGLVEPGQLISGEVLYHNKDGSVIDLSKMNYSEIIKFRWAKISMVFQGAQSVLNPVYTIYNQFKETLEVHNGKMKKEDILKKCKHVLSIVNLDADRVLKMYPHELSGGMKQRVMIAFSLLLDPEMIILDEPTTALDVITQEYIFSLLKNISKEMNITMLLLTHDMGIVAKYSDYLGVMYAGKLMEYGTTDDVFEFKYHPYTRQLIGATPSLYFPKEDIRSIDGQPPNMLNYPKGCPFHPRCLRFHSICSEVEPETIQINDIHCAKCHLYVKEGENNGQ